MKNHIFLWIKIFFSSHSGPVEAPGEGLNKVKHKKSSLLYRNSNCITLDTIGGPVHTDWQKQLPRTDDWFKPQVWCSRIWECLTCAYICCFSKYIIYAVGSIWALLISVNAGIAKICVPLNISLYYSQMSYFEYVAKLESGVMTWIWGFLVLLLVRINQSGQLAELEDNAQCLWEVPSDHN